MNETVIRAMRMSDESEVLNMMRGFYASPAVHTSGSDEIFKNDFDNCINDNPYLEGYILEGPDGVRGYGMIAKSFSTEFGMPCIWIEDIFIKEPYRALGIGRMFLDHIADRYKNCLIRLEAEEENEKAVRVYKNNGYEVLPYMELYRHPKHF